jgi:transcriptional regulator
MYRVEQFVVEDPSTLMAHLSEHPFASLVVNGEAGPSVEHLPFLVDDSIGDRGALLGHVSRGNPLWQQSEPCRALAVFVGHQAYVSPAWYATKASDPRVVPTWNYAAVHVSGTLRFFHDRARLHALLTRLTERFEAKRPNPWQVSDAPADFVDRMAQGIVGVELQIDGIQGKWKLSQNRPPADRLGVIDGLRREAGETGAAMADIMSDAMAALEASAEG